MIGFIVGDALPVVVSHAGGVERPQTVDGAQTANCAAQGEEILIDLFREGSREEDGEDDVRETH